MDDGVQVTHHACLVNWQAVGRKKQAAALPGHHNDWGNGWVMQAVVDGRPLCRKTWLRWLMKASSMAVSTVTM